MDEAQLSALINAAVKEAVERTTAELNARHESDTEGLRRKRDELLNKVAKKDGQQKTWEEVSAEWDRDFAEQGERLAKRREQDDRLMGKTSQPVAPTVTAHTISRDKARDTQAYREAKAAAQKAGVELLIVDEHSPAQQAARRSSPVAMIHDEVGGVLHVNVRLVEKHGQQRMRQLAADKGATLRAFGDAKELPDDIAARHAEIIASGDRSNLLQGGGE